MDDARRYLAEGWWRRATVVDDLRRVTSLRPDGIAIAGHRATTGAVDTVTWRELSQRVDRFAGALLELGVGRGDVVSLQLPNWWELTALCLATARIGAVVNPIIPIFRRREVEFMLVRTEARVCVAPAKFRGFSHADMLRDVADAVPTLEHVVVIGGDGDGDAVDFGAHFVDTAWEATHSPEKLDAMGPDPGDLAQILFTSGTTGEPKGVMHSHNTLYAATRAMTDALGLHGDDVVTMGSPMTHQAGYIYCFLMPLLLGATAVYQDAWDADVMLELVEAHGVTFAMGATPFVLDAIAAQRARPRDLSTLRYFACGGTPIPPHVVEDAAEVLGTRLFALWGMTENGTVTITRPEDPDDLAARSDGRPLPWMECRIVGDDGNDVAEGATGMLEVRGASQCLGYYKRPDLYAAALDSDGWFDTGDLAHSDGHGGIRIAGRVKDIIIRGGENIPVVELEGALYRHPAVREVAVVAYPDERLGERACAIVAPSGDTAPTLEDLQSYLAELGMAKQYWPERVEVVDELPKTPSGKIQKYLLRLQLERS
ncbi:MAG TPA: AMP-binding protein [Actinomycetota bacterium]|nr:AMP-binding protein [Actinomycetota bacterium]